MLGYISSVIDKEFNNLGQRVAFVSQELARLTAGSRLLDAGAGSQQFRKFAGHLDYVSQDFEQYSVDQQTGFAASSVPYQYGATDIVSNIWSIPAPSESFDAVLCTEVLEHVPYPRETIRELGRLLKPGGKLILTAPSNCLRHFDPYFFSSGYSDRWYETVLPEAGLEIERLEPVGDYFSWMKVEIFRTIAQRKLSAFALLPALLFFKLSRPTESSVSTLCMGYHLVAKKRV